MAFKDNPSTAMPKRFYKEVQVEKEGSKFQIKIDGRVLKTMARNPLLLSQEAIAHAIAKEWDEQLEVVNPNSMPLTRLANIAIDRVPMHRAEILADILLYAETDLLCHRATEPELEALQQEKWTPPLQFLEKMMNIHMVLATGVIPRGQPPESLKILRETCEAMSDETLAGFAMLVPLLGSILLALALWKKGLSLDEALSACRLDEHYQQQRWGSDAQMEQLWQLKSRDILACVQWLYNVS